MMIALDLLEREFHGGRLAGPIEKIKTNALALLDDGTGRQAAACNLARVFQSECSDTSQAVLIQTALTLRYSSICWSPDSRP